MPVIDRNARARAMFHAEALDRRTRRPRQHGGMLKRTGLAVLKALLFQFANIATGRCDPSFGRIAEVAGVARSTVAKALKRLEAAGLLTRRGRHLRGPWGSRRISNAYAFPALPGPESGNRAGTTNRNLEPKSARTVPLWRDTDDPTTPAEARVQAREMYEQIVRARAERQRRGQAVAV